MEYRIRAYVDELFEKAPKTQKAYELKIELTQNLIDKYYAMVSEGKSEEDAYRLTVLGIGDINELFVGLEEEEYQPRSVSPEKEPEEKRRAALTAIAIMMYILSVVPLIVLKNLGGFFETIGVVLLFFMVACATGLLIYSSMTKPGRKEGTSTVVADFRDWQSQKEKSQRLWKAIRSAFWPIVLAVYFLLSFSTGKWGITWIIFLIAPAVEAILRALFASSEK